MKILPFNSTPSIKNYQLKAFELGIIEAYEKNIKPWIYNKYINQLYMVKDKRFSFTNYDRWHASEGVTECQKLCVKASMLESKECGIDILQLIHDMINTGHYVYGRYNEYYIPKKSSYQIKYYVHDFLIYGYDDAKQIYYSAGYLFDRKYQAFTIPYSNFYNSLKSVTTEKLNFHFIRYKNGINNSLDLRTIYEDLFDYLHSINRRNIVNYGKVFGISCENMFVEYLKQLYQEKELNSVDMRHVKLFLELKTLMSERLAYLEEQSYLKVGISERYDKIRKKEELISLLSLKYNLHGNKNILLQLMELQNEIINEEREILTLVLNQLDIGAARCRRN